MARFLIVRDGADGTLEYRSRGIRGTKTGGGWTPKTAGAAKWTSAESADRAVVTLNANVPDAESARVLEIIPTRARGTVAADKPEKPAKAAKAKTPARQRAPRKPKGVKKMRYQCTFCQRGFYKTPGPAENCRCEGAKRVRAAGRPTPAHAVMIDPMAVVRDKTPIKRHVAVAVSTAEGEKVAVLGTEPAPEPKREPVEATP